MPVVDGAGGEEGVGGGLPLFTSWLGWEAVENDSGGCGQRVAFKPSTAKSKPTVLLTPRKIVRALPYTPYCTVLLRLAFGVSSRDIVSCVCRSMSSSTLRRRLVFIFDAKCQGQRA